MSLVDSNQPAGNNAGAANNTRNSAAAETASQNRAAGPGGIETRPEGESPSGNAGSRKQTFAKGTRRGSKAKGGTSPDTGNAARDILKQTLENYFNKNYGKHPASAKSQPEVIRDTSKGDFKPSSGLVSFGDGEEEYSEERRKAVRDAEHRALTTFAPDAAGIMRLQFMRLSPEQRAEVLNISKRSTMRNANVSQYCTPLNAPWIFAVIDELIGNLRESDAHIEILEPFLIYPFILAQNIEAAYLFTPINLQLALKARINAVADALPSLLEAVQWAGYIIESSLIGDERCITIEGIKAEAIRMSAFMNENMIQPDALE